MKSINSKLFEKFEDLKIVNESFKKIVGGTMAIAAPGGTTNDCTGTGGDCWDNGCGTSVMEDSVMTGGKESGNDTCN